ncbi:MAG: DUF4397 domain-containing protein [Bacteroidetes bacterium]|nr:DUF4397 domain-containing protein [Bacteroidota bacterium]
MRQKLLQKAGLLSLMLLATGVFLSGCIEEPNPPVLDRVTSQVRFVHAVPDGPAVDIWVDGAPVATNVGFKGYSGYLTVNSGNRFLRVVPAGADSSAAIFRQLVAVRSLTKMTMAFFNSVAEVNLLITQERFTYADETSMLVDSTDVKLINLAGTGEAYSLEQKIDEQTSKELVAPVNAGSLSAYNRVAAGTMDLFIARSNGSRAFEFNHALSTPGYRYSFIAVGNSGGLEVLTLQDEPTN